jgi:hypothetical protein
MTEIYRHASAIVVWLGPEEGNSKLGMDFLNEVGAFVAETEFEGDPGSEFSDMLYRTLSNATYKMHWDGLSQIFQRSYWSRLWVIQELVVTPHPDEVWLLCGSSQARFTSLRMITQQIWLLSGGAPFICDQRSLDGRILRLRSLVKRLKGIATHVDAWGIANRGDREIGILRLLSRYYQQLCADPRDRVYALLGVSARYSGVELPITYTIPVRDVYKNLAKYVIAGSKRLNILLEAGQDMHSMPSRPSWVPDCR